MKKIISDRYKILEILGQGGMADVYLAYDIILDRTVALKMLRTNLAKEPIYVTRFKREATAASSLNHKNIVEIYDVCEEDDMHYLVMEYVPGVTLKELINRRGALHVVEAIDIMIQITSGVLKAHEMGIVHRDLKPQNVLVTESGTAKIADFGIASIENLAQVTQTDVIMGSLHYLAPELARGEKATVQSDIYALGIVLYELLRGEAPFVGDSPINIAMRHMQEETPSIRAFNSTILQSIENIIIKATAKNMKDRYASIQEMYFDLTTCLQRENEEKVVFAYDPNTDPTIVVDANKMPTQEHKNFRDFYGDDTNPPIKNNKVSKKKIGMIVGVAALLLVTFVLGFLLVSQANPEVYRMPDITGMSVEEAKALLQDEYELTISNTIIEKPSNEHKKGLIILSDPAAGTSVKAGTTVVIAISSGEIIRVGNYLDLTIEEAKAELEKLDFTVTVKEEPSSKEPGIVLKQSITKGTEINPEDSRTIELTVSSGTQIKVDDYTDMTYTRAQSMLSALGFKVTRKDVHSDTPTGIVVGQSIAKDTVLKHEQVTGELTIELSVSIGKEMVVPNVLGQTIESAKALLKSLGFTVNEIDLGVTDDESKVNVIEKQSPMEDVVMEVGDTVVIVEYYSEYQEVTGDVIE